MRMPSNVQKKWKFCYMQNTTANSETLIQWILRILTKIFHLKYKTKRTPAWQSVEGFFGGISLKKFLIIFEQEISDLFLQQRTATFNPFSIVKCTTLQSDERGLCQATVCTLFFCCPHYYKGCTFHRGKECGSGGLDGGKDHVDEVCSSCPIVTNPWLRLDGNSDGDVTVKDVIRLMAVWNEVGNQFTHFSCCEMFSQADPACFA